MGKLTKLCIDRLNDVSLFSVVPGTEGSGMTRMCKCPACGAEGKVKGKKHGLVVVDDQVKRKRFIKCNDCGLKAGGGAINVLMTISGLEFRDACVKLSDMIGIQLEYERDDVRKPVVKRSKSFLVGNGIPVEDVINPCQRSESVGCDGGSVPSALGIVGSDGLESVASGVDGSNGVDDCLSPATNLLRSGDVLSPEADLQVGGDGLSTANELRSGGDLDGDGKVRRGAGRHRAFVTRQLEESGLSYEDVMARVVIDGEECTVSPFRRGALDPVSGEVDETKDEMLIVYYDLEGRQRLCTPSKFKSRTVGYNRVRWSNPEAHSDKFGKPVKYQTIMGAKSCFFFPEAVRSRYRSRTQFDTLYIQEGEKKAEKACKHGILSIAMQGIGNVGNKEDGLSDEIQYLVQRCGIRNIVMLMDADWNDLKRDLQNDDRVESRPKAFAAALIKFRNYIKTLALCGLDIDIWFAHLNGNEAGDKGIDDLLCNTLKGREDELLQDLERTRLTHDGCGRYADVMNITSWSDMKIEGLWNLNSAEDFFEAHRERLMALKSFRFQKVFYVVDGGEIRVATEFGEGRDFWRVSLDDKKKKRIEVDLIEMRSFLHANGFRSYRNEEGKRALVRIEQGIINHVDEFDVRDFIFSYVFKATKDHAVHLEFAESIDTRLSSSKLLQMQLLVTNAGKPTVDGQRFYFQNSQITITTSGIEVLKLTGPVWDENLVHRTFERVRIFERFEPDGNGSFRFGLTQDGRECEFLSYVLRTCDMWKGRNRSAQQDHDFRLHVANRITSIGYLLRDYRDMGENKAVVAMDATMSEVGVNNGRSGKSLIGMALKQFIKQAYIDGPNLDNNDSFIFSDVRRTTKNVFLDDIKQDFDFKRFKARITGDLNVNIKQGGRFVIPYEESPKFYLTSNHALDDLDPSCRARLVFMAFSPWYHEGYSPENEFGHLFFEGWSDRQWQLFDNFMAECVMFYMRSAEGRWGEPNKGIVNPPMEDLDRRTFRQEMGESFLSWAELYFSADGGNLNRRINRKDIYEAYLGEYGLKSTQMTARTFSGKLKSFCRYAGLHLNAHRPSDDGCSFADHFSRKPGESFIGSRDVTGSVEYYTLTTTAYLIESELRGS